LPTRRAFAEKMLRECGMGDHTRRFHAFNRNFPNDFGVQLPNAPRESSCIPWGKEYSLAELYMMGCLDQLQWEESPLSAREKALLQSPMLTHDELEQRFTQGFNAAWAPLRREILVPALQDQIASMSERNAQ
jgi:hypothetical protein